MFKKLVAFYLYRNHFSQLDRVHLPIQARLFYKPIIAALMEISPMETSKKINLRQNNQLKPPVHVLIICL